MGEPQPPGLRLVEQAQQDGRFQRVEQVFGVAATEFCKQVDVDVTSQHRGLTQCRHGRPRQPG
ncbi:hypothetical protein BN975_03560 [Mycolicibacterium farcinogenes]|nr:hypothetical protein BN975_03560 [Mycolicibacterium farcinogenes]